MVSYLLRTLIVLVFPISGFAQTAQLNLEQQAVFEVVKAHLSPPYSQRDNLKIALAYHRTVDFWLFFDSALDAMVKTPGNGQTFRSRRAHLINIIGADLRGLSSEQKFSPENVPSIKANLQVLLKSSSGINHADRHTLSEMYESLGKFEAEDLSFLIKEIKIHNDNEKYIIHAVELAPLATPQEKQLLLNKAKSLIRKKGSNAFVGYSLQYWSHAIADEDMVWLVRRMLEAWVWEGKSLSIDRIMRAFTYESKSKAPLSDIKDLLAKTTNELRDRYQSGDYLVRSIIDELLNSPTWRGKNWLDGEVAVVEGILNYIVAPGNCEQILLLGDINGNSRYPSAKTMYSPKANRHLSSSRE